MASQEGDGGELRSHQPACSLLLCPIAGRSPSRVCIKHIGEHIASAWDLTPSRSTATLLLLTLRTSSGDQIYPKVVFVSSAARTSIESGTVSGASELTPIHSIQLLCGSTESDTRIISVGGVRLR